jgi:hypothetical protein
MNLCFLEHISVNSLETLPWAIKKEHEKANEKEIDLSTITGPYICMGLDTL